MAKRLFKVAKELNVGLGTIVSHLKDKGYELEQHPRTEVSDELYNILLRDFQKSRAIKEQADNLNIGSRHKKEQDELGSQDQDAPLVQQAPPPPPPPPTLKPEITPPKPKVEPEVVKPEKTQLAGPKVVGKIDLEQQVTAKKEPAPPTKVDDKEDINTVKLEEAPKKEAVKPTPPKVVEEPIKEAAPKADLKETKTEKETPKATTKTKEETAKEEKPQPSDKVKKDKSKPAKKVSPKTSKPKETVAAKDKTEEKELSPKTEAAPKEVQQEVVKEATKEPKKATKKKESKQEKPDIEKTEEAKKQPVANEAEPADANVEGTKSNEEDEKFRAKTPKLKGLKILGKIDPNRFKKPSAKKKSEDSEELKKRKRKRKRLPTNRPSSGNDKNQRSAQGNNSNSNNNNTNKEQRSSDNKTKTPRSTEGTGRKKPLYTPARDRKPSSNSSGPGAKRPRRVPPHRRRNVKEEPKEVSQKEIQEQIKATMARLSGGGKSKRSKHRRSTRDKHKEQQLKEQQTTQQEKKMLSITEFISVSEIASLMGVSVTDVIMTCMNLGVIVSINQRLDAEIIELVADEYDYEVSFISAEEQADVEEEEIVDVEEDLVPRAPIVTVMGHVDHGKTSLLDYIRNANVIDGEAGGITQHIGAYEVKLENDKRITFLDTPGHEAFTAMRARGAKVTDVAIIVVAADDSIMPQTKEAISHAQAAGVPIVFAINKIDKDNARPERIKEQLAGMNLLVEEWGGKYQSHDISAKLGQHIDGLLEKVALEAELLDLKANPDRKAIGVVLEASLDKGRGYVTKMLVQTGTLSIGMPFTAGPYSGKVKAMFNERGQRVTEAGPSTPVLVLGLDGAPQAGEKFKVMDSEQDARSLATKRSQISRSQEIRATKRLSLEEIGRRLALGSFKELNLIVKGDVDGTVEALSDALLKLSIDSVQVNVVHKAVGQIIESDILLASASDAIIIGFQVRPSGNARKLAEKEGVQIKTYSVIYDAIEEIKLAIEGMLEPTKEEKVTCQVEVRETYKISRVGTVAGCFVQDGKISRNTKIRLVRNGIVVFPIKEGVVGELDSLRRYKDDVKEVNRNTECGITIKNFNDIKVGDIIEGYEIIEVKQTLN